MHLLQNFFSQKIYIILLVVFSTLCFANIPLFWRFDTLSSGYSAKFTWYPLIILAMYYLYLAYHGNLDKNKLKVTPTMFIKFLVIYLSITLLSTLVGLYVFPYGNLYAVAGMSPRWAEILLHSLHLLNIKLNNVQIFEIQIVVRTLKGTLFSTFYTWGFSYVLYYFIRQKPIFYYKLLIKGIYISLAFLFSYSFIEILYLSGNEMACQLLKEITPFFHVVRENNSWWPPLLFPGRLRSIFAEPSYLGIYAAFATPFLWAKFIEKKSVCTGCALLFFTFMIFMTQSRTAVVVFLGEGALLGLLSLLCNQKSLFYNISIIASISFMAFVMALFFPVTYGDISDNNSGRFNVAVSKYIDNNISSITKAEASQKSNDSRYSVLNANIAVGLDYPLLGVGTNLNSAYLPDYINKNTLAHNPEVQQWIRSMKQNGMLISGIPNMGEYATRFSQNGLLGLIAFLIPWLIIMVKLPIRLIKLKNTNKVDMLRVGTIFISCAGTLVCGFADNMEILYTPWILLSFAYSFAFEILEGK